MTIGHFILIKLNNGHLGVRMSQALLKARDLDEKAERRRTILRAANALLDIRRQTLPPASAIAAEAGLAKGTLYLYFQTKEEIYLALLGEWFGLLLDVLRPAVESDAPTVENLVRRYTRFCAKNPRFMFLASMSASILEQNISEDMAHAFKKSLVDNVGAMTQTLAAKTSADETQLRKGFIHMFSLSTGLWQHCHPPQVVERAYTRGDAQLIEMDFEQDLYTALLGLFGSMLS